MSNNIAVNKRSLNHIMQHSIYFQFRHPSQEKYLAEEDRFIGRGLSGEVSI